MHVTTTENNNSHATFDGITITKGNANGLENNTDYAAAVYGGGNVHATNCIFSENSATYGGVAYYGNWTANNCTFSGNSAASEGGVAWRGTWTTNNCNFLGNSSSSEGGVAWRANWTASNCTFSANSAVHGGAVARLSSWTANNCAFFGNSGGAGAVASEGTWTVTNCTFSDNSSSSIGGVALYSTWTATNCTFSGNSSNGGGVAYGGTWRIFNNIFHNNPGNGQFLTSTIHILQTTTPNPYTIYANNLIQGGSAAFVSCTIPFPIPEANIIDADPVFVDINDPDGPDDIWGTQDDGHRLQSSSPAIGYGVTQYLPVDTYDFDDDGDVTELIPVDIANYIRIQDGALDLGAYEFGEQNGLISFFTVSVSTDSGGTVNQDGSTVYYQPVNLSLLATPLEGFVFSRWIGNIEASVENDNPLTLTATNDFSITASFTPDLSDLDFDGLTHYDEKVTYNTNPNIDDTSGDGLKDGVVVSAGFDPTVDYSNLVNASRQGMTDLRAGSTMIAVENGEAILSMELEKSDDLEIWTSGGTTDLQIPLDNDTDTKFFRFKMAE